jgi:hypothetical protein
MGNYSELKETKAFKYAITSVILGFLTAILLVLSAVPSIIYAIKALRGVRSYSYSKDTRTIKRIAWFGLVLGLTGFVLSIYSIIIIIQVFVL